MMIDQLQGTRARMQRLRDAKFFSGWVVKASSDLLEIQVANSSVLSAGDRFSVEVNGKVKAMAFECELKSQKDTLITLIVCSGPRPIPSSEPPRIKKSGVSARVSHGQKVHETSVLDVSESGVGFSSLEEIPKGTEVSMLVVSGNLQLLIAGVTTYDRADTSQPGRHRIGVQIKGLDRQTENQWFDFVNEYMLGK